MQEREKQGDTREHAGAGKGARSTTSRLHHLTSHAPLSALLALALFPPAGSSDIGQALCQYAKDKEVELVVVGSRGLGAWERSLMSAMGLGSVSDFL